MGSSRPTGGALSARYELPATYVPRDGTVQCEAPSQSALPPELASVSALIVRLSVNGQQWTADAPSFNYFASSVAVAHLLSPPSGSIEGGTVLMLGLVGLNASSAAPVRADARAVCTLNHSAVPASVSSDGSAIRCVTPPSEVAGDTVVRVSLNGQQLLRLDYESFDTSLSRGGSSPSVFHYYVPPRLQALQPLAGPSIRGASLAVTLTPPVPLSAASGVRCRIGAATTLGALLPPTSHQNAAAAAVVYSPRALAPVDAHIKLPQSAAHLRDPTSGTYLLQRFVVAGLTEHEASRVQYDADPIDSYPAGALFTPDGRKYDLEQHATVGGTERWMASAVVSQWYYDGRATCVGYGPPDDYCNSSQCVTSSMLARPRLLPRRVRNASRSVALCNVRPLPSSAQACLRWC